MDKGHSIVYDVQLGCERTLHQNTFGILHAIFFRIILLYDGQWPNKTEYYIPKNTLQSTHIMEGFNKEHCIDV